MERRRRRDHCSIAMSADDSTRSPELEEVRALLFPHLSREEGWRRIDAAIEGADDTERTNRIEALAQDLTVDDELLRRLRELRNDRA